MLSKQFKHLQRSTSKPLPLAHFCLVCAGGDATETFVVFLHTNIRQLFPCGSGKQGPMKESIISLIKQNTENDLKSLTLIH